MFKKTIYLCLLLLTACAQTPTTQYYRLPDSVFRQPENHHEQKTKIIRVELDEGLSDNALMYQTSETNIHYTHHHRWASRLNQDIANTLANAANQRGHHALYLPVGDCPCVVVHLNRFQGNYHGMVEISGYIAQQDADGKKHFQGAFSHQIQQQGDGYAAMVKALNQLLKDAVVRELP